MQALFWLIIAYPLGDEAGRRLDLEDQSRHAWGGIRGDRLLLVVAGEDLSQPRSCCLRLEAAAALPQAPLVAVSFY